MTQIDAPARSGFRRSEGSAQGQSSQVNVADQERLLSGILGGALTLVGVTRRTIPGLLLAGVGAGMLYRAKTGHCHMYEALGIDTAHGEGAGAAPEEYFDHGIHVAQAFTIQKSPEELYAFWRDFNNLPQIFSHLESVQVQDEKRSHWVARGPLNMKYEWDAEIINEEPNRLIAWRSLGSADVDNSGSVRFVEAPAGRGTELKVVMDYIPTGGAVGKALATMIGQNPESQIREDLRRFKRVMETGLAPTTEGQPRGACAGGKSA